MKIPLVDLKRQYDSIKPEIDEALGRVLTNTDFILGQDVQAFEEEFAGFCEVKYAIGVSSGTDALHLALLACGIGPGDEVITVPNTFIATAEAITYCGARPVFVDVDPLTYDINARLIEEKITSKSKAIIPVHLYGQPADMNPIAEIAGRYDLRVIEDAAQAHGARYKGDRVGNFGYAACFSFYPAKNLGAYGDGGIVVTNDDEIAKQVRLLRNHGRVEKYEHLIEGFGNRLDTLQAAVLRVKLKHLEEWNLQRRRNARLYNELLEDTGVVTPHEMEGVEAVYYVYVIAVENRDRLRQRLEDKGIATGIYYPLPLHLQPAYRHLGYRRGDFPVTERSADGTLALPMFPELTREEIEYVAETVKEAI